jgi:hypothetical protein
MEVAVVIYGLLAAWCPWPRAWWKYDFAFITNGSFTSAIGPCVLVLGLILAKLYKGFPVSCAFASMTIALLITVAGVLDDPRLILPTLRR